MGSGQRAAGSGRWAVGQWSVPGAGSTVPRFLEVCYKGRRMALARRVGPGCSIPWRCPGSLLGRSPSRARGRYASRTRLPGPTTVHRVVCGSILHCNQPCGSLTQASGRLSETRRDQLARSRQLTAGTAAICGGGVGGVCLSASAPSTLPTLWEPRVGPFVQKRHCSKGRGKDRVGQQSQQNQD